MAIAGDKSAKVFSQWHVLISKLIMVTATVLVLDSITYKHSLLSFSAAEAAFVVPETTTRSATTHRCCFLRPRTDGGSYACPRSGGVASGAFAGVVSKISATTNSRHYYSNNKRRRRPFIISSSSRLTVSASRDNIVDAEFERVEENDDSLKPKAKEENNKQTSNEKRSSSPGKANSEKSLFELSLEASSAADGSQSSDLDLNNLRIPFVDTGPDMDGKYIDAKLAFTVELDGVTYGIGCTFDPAAAIVFEKPDGTVVNVPPDPEPPGIRSKEATDDGNSNKDEDVLENRQELMEIFAAQLQENVDEDLKLIKTPRCLTIAGPLEKYTDQWQDNLLPKPVSTKELLDESDEDLDYFLDFMKKELGEEEVAKTLAGTEDTIKELGMTDEELLELFGGADGISDTPFKNEGGDDDDADLAAMEDILKSTLLSTPEEQLQEFQKANGIDLDHDGVALKLVSYTFPKDKKAYSLVHLLKPYVLVGRYCNDDKESDEMIRFDLIPPEEEKVLFPRLEQICKLDLEKAGLSLQQN